MQPASFILIILSILGIRMPYQKTSHCPAYRLYCNIVHFYKKKLSYQVKTLQHSTEVATTSVSPCSPRGSHWTFANASFLGPTCSAKNNLHIRSETFWRTALLPAPTRFGIRPDLWLSKSNPHPPGPVNIWPTTRPVPVMNLTEAKIKVPWSSY